MEDPIDVDMIIDCHNGKIGAINSLEAIITRRAKEGKTSPRASAELKALLDLPVNYRSPKEIAWSGPDDCF